MATSFTIAAYSQAHTAAVLEICRQQGWASYAASVELTHRALTAPGVTSLVALDPGDAVLGVVQVQGDGVIQAHVSLLVVRASARRRGVGRALVHAAVTGSGCRRADLLVEDDSAAAFYASFPHRRGTGFRIYPPARGPSDPT